MKCRNCGHLRSVHQDGVSGCIRCVCPAFDFLPSGKATNWVGISLATPCGSCEHSANMHEGPESAVKTCLVCSCAEFSLQCRALRTPFFPQDSGEHRCALGINHLGDHTDGDLSWPEIGAHYPDPELNAAQVTIEGAKAVRDSQVGGDHYRKFKIQPWDVIDEYGLTFYAGNALKYLLRAGRKGPALEDLKKARHYLDRMIETEEEKEG